MRRMRFVQKTSFVSLVLLLLSSLPGVAAQAEDANAAIKRRDYPAAIRVIRPQAEQGDANAQYNLGLLYDNGLGVPQDKVRAYMWLSLAAAQGRESAAALRDLIARR